MSRGPSALDRRLEQAGDRLNPILLREVRQWLRSRHFVGMFLLLLGICWFAAMFESIIPGSALRLLTYSPWVQLYPDGQSLFAFYFLVLATSVFLTVPVTAFFNFTREFANDAIETLHMTPLASARIAWGKLQTALVQMGLYFAAVTPFVSLTYLLRGIDLMTIVLSLVLIGMGGTSLAVLGLALGSSSRSLGWQVFNILLLIAGTGLALLGFLSFGFAFMRLGHLENLLAGFVCLSIFGAIAMTIGMGFTISNVRPREGVLTIPFLGFARLRRVAEAGRALAEILRREFPLAGVPRDWTTEASAAFPEAHLEAMRRALVLERALFDKPTSFSNRNRYMTHAFARESLRSLLYTFDLILFELSWNGLSVELLQPRVGRVRGDGTPAVPQINPALLDTLEKSAAEIEQLCLENPDADRPVSRATREREACAAQSPKCPEEIRSS